MNFSFSLPPVLFQTTNFFVKEEPIDTDKNGGNKSEATESSESETPLGKPIYVYFIFMLCFLYILTLCSSFHSRRCLVVCYFSNHPVFAPQFNYFYMYVFIHKVSFISLCLPVR